MIFVFDFDRTLFDTKIFTKELCKIFNLTEKEYNFQIDEYFRTTKKHYSPERHIKLLGKIKSADVHKLHKDYKKLLKSFDKMLFP
jgi:phosphoserine phosphatase